MTSGVKKWCLFIQGGFSQWGFQAAGGWSKATIFYHFRKKTSFFLGSLPEAFTTNNLHFAYVPEISSIQFCSHSLNGFVCLGDCPVWSLFYLILTACREVIHFQSQGSQPEPFVSKGRWGKAAWTRDGGSEGNGGPGQALS